MQSIDQKIPLAAQNWFAKGSFKTLSGQGPIFVIDDGDKKLPALLLIHGFPSASWDYEKVWPELLKYYRLITLDMLGFGFSAKPNQRNYSILRQADLFDAILEELNIEEFHILAHDYGDTVAQELLARQFDYRQNSNAKRGAQCLSCCFLNGGLFPETHQALLIQKLLLSPLGKLVNKFTGYPQFVNSFSRVFGEHTKPSTIELKTLWGLINYNEGRHVFHNLITYMSDRKQHRERWVNALQVADCPLGLINGSVDPVSGKHLVRRYQELGCRLDYLHEMPDTGHYPQMEKPSEVAHHALTFFQQASK